MSGASKRELRAALQALVDAGHSHTYVTASPAFGHAIRTLRRTAPADAKLVLMPRMAEALRLAAPFLDQLGETNEFAADAAAKVRAARAAFEA